MVSFEDVSTDPAYRTLVGQALEAPNELMIFGVSLDRNYARRIDKCVLTQRPGLDGPEVIVRGTVPAGTLFTVSGVERCIDCLFEERVELLLSTSAHTPCGSAPITINHSQLGSLLVPTRFAHVAPN